MSSLHRTSSSWRGFSLMELMLAVAILGIIVTLAYPSYRDTVLRTHRTEATHALIDVANRMTVYFSRNKTYTDNLLALGLGTDPFITENGYYSLAVRDNGGGGGACPIATCFELDATPVGTQTDDTDCAEIQFNSSGVKTAFADDNSQNNSCW